VKSRQALQILAMTTLGMVTTTGMGLNLSPLQQNSPTGGPTAQASTTPPPSTGVLAQTSASDPLASSDPHRWRDRAAAGVEPPEPPPLPERPGRRPTVPVTLPGYPARPAAPATPDVPSAPVSEPVPQDPAEEIAPAVIELTPGPGGGINPMLSHAMQQQLRNLIGRFESALLMANSLEASTTLRLTEQTPALTAADKENLEPVRPDHDDLPPVLVEAQQLLAEWETLMANGEQTQLQDRWLQTRAALWEQMPRHRPYAQAEIRAIWLDRGTIVAAGSAPQLATLFDQLAAAGINTVFFETVNAGYPIYPSRVAPQQNPLTSTWDPLQAAVELAHQRGMTLHAWVWVFAVGNQRHNRILNLPNDYLGPVLTQHPDWAGYDNRGNPIPRGQDKPFLDPANPEVRSYLTQLMTEIVTEYGVDGLHLDYIRYPFQDPGANRTYGYGEVSRWRFHSITGVDPLAVMARPDAAASPNQRAQQQVLWARWTEYRIQQVNSFVETLAQTLRRQRPDLILSAAVFAKPEPERLAKIQQDWGTWARNGDIDWVVLMSYAEDTSRFEQLITPWLVAEDFGAALVLPGIRILDRSRPEVIDQLQVTRDLPTPGYALFATADLQTDLATFLAQTQGAASAQPQSPFQMAFARYQALQREWSWLLSQQKLWMEREKLAAWVNAVNRLEAEFETLAEAPSHRHLATAQQGLVQVQRPLEGTILIETANGSYRLQAWQHRLTTIERLLRYGEQTTL
jgi:uncharacterized lipoprotein YddW (UPF0748 family)